MKSAEECQELVVNLILAIKNQHSAPNNPRRVVELWDKMGETCAVFVETPQCIYARQHQYRAFLGERLYEKISSRAAVRIPLTFSESIRVSESVSRNQMDDMEVLYTLLLPEQHSEFEYSTICDLKCRSFR
jgi:hypothetical protein